MQTILFFDLDSTLVENHFSRKAIGPLLQQIADDAGLSVDTILERMTEENLHRQQHDPDNVLTMDWDDIVRQLAREYDVALSESVDERWQRVANREDVEVLDNAPAVLKRLQSSGRKLVLATKGLSKYQNAVLDLTGLGQFFDDILTPDRTGYLKTSPDYFANYQDADGLRIQIGDHYYDDVICPKRNGFHSVLRAPVEAFTVFKPFERPALIPTYSDQIKSFPPEGSDVLPDAVVISLEELPHVIRRLEAQQG